MKTNSKIASMKEKVYKNVWLIMIEEMKNIIEDDLTNNPHNFWHFDWNFIWLNFKWKFVINFYKINV